MHVTFVTEQTFDENFSRGAKPELQNPAERPSRAGGAPPLTPTRARVTRVTRMYAHAYAHAYAHVRARIRACTRTHTRMYARYSFSRAHHAHTCTRITFTHHAHTYTHHIHTSHAHTSHAYMHTYAHISCASRHAYHAHAPTSAPYQRGSRITPMHVSHITPS